MQSPKGWWVGWDAGFRSCHRRAEGLVTYQPGQKARVFEMAMESRAESLIDARVTRRHVPSMDQAFSPLLFSFEP